MSLKVGDGKPESGVNLMFRVLTELFRTIKPEVCSSCKQEALGIFYWYDELRLDRIMNTFFRQCWGCQLKGVLLLEADHYKYRKRLVMKEWLCEDEEWNENDLPKALEDFITKGIKDGADKIDGQRYYDMFVKQGWERYDREFDERQVYFEGKRLNEHRRSPTVAEKDRHLNKNPWDWHHDGAKWGHGHGGLD